MTRLSNINERSSFVDHETVNFTGISLCNDLQQSDLLNRSNRRDRFTEMSNFSSSRSRELGSVDPSEKQPYSKNEKSSDDFFSDLSWIIRKSYQDSETPSRIRGSSIANANENDSSHRSYYDHGKMDSSIRLTEFLSNINNSTDYNDTHYDGDASYKKEANRYIKYLEEEIDNEILLRSEICSQFHSFIMFLQDKGILNQANTETLVSLLQKYSDKNEKLTNKRSILNRNIGQIKAELDECVSQISFDCGVPFMAQKSEHHGSSSYIETENINEHYELLKNEISQRDDKIRSLCISFHDVVNCVFKYFSSQTCPSPASISNDINSLPNIVSSAKKIIINEARGRQNNASQLSNKTKEVIDDVMNLLNNVSNKVTLNHQILMENFVE